MHRFLLLLPLLLPGCTRQPAAPPMFASYEMEIVPAVFTQADVAKLNGQIVKPDLAPSEVSAPHGCDCGDKIEVLDARVTKLETRDRSATTPVAPPPAKQHDAPVRQDAAGGAGWSGEGLRRGLFGGLPVLRRGRCVGGCR